MLRYAIVDTRFGFVAVAGSEAGLRRVTLPAPSVDSVIERVEDPGEGGVEDARAFADLSLRLQSYFEGEDVAFDDRLDLKGATPFQVSVWNATRSIPRGETRSYSWVARAAGSPGAFRAVGNALGRNPLAVVVPCHRVIAGDGGLGGFGGGLEMKTRLLRLESLSRAPDEARRALTPV
jgi:O-6-methylguanine DNA methyltransferase